MKKRGQVTVFIIVGIIILISVSLIFIYQDELVSRTKIVYPVEVEPVAFAVKDCLEQKANEGLALLGSQGGHIYMPPHILQDRNLYADIGLKIPYWKKGNIINIPSLDRMSFDLSQYINDNMKDCLGDFSDFMSFEVTEIGPVSTNTTIGDEAIIFFMKYPLKIKTFSTQSEYEITDFEYISNIKLKRLWQLSNEIIDREIETKKFGSVTFDLISMDDKIPLVGYDISCNKRKWQISDIENRLKELLAFNLPLLKIKKTEMESFPEEFEYMNTHFIWDATDFSYKDVAINFGLMQSEPFTLYISPNKGDQLHSGVVNNPETNNLGINIDLSSLTSLLCFQMWKFNYDLSYTAFANVLDEKSGYKFTFVFDVGISKNRPVDAQPIPVDYEAYIPQGTNDDFCNEKVNDLTIFTNEFTNNELFGGSLSNVNLKFDCMQFSCDLGNSIPISEDAGLKVKVPRCDYGFVRANREGYLDAEEVVELGETEVTLNLIPLHKSNNFIIRKYIWNDVVGDWYIDDVSGNEYALISLAGKLEKDGETFERTSSTIYPREENVQDYFELFKGSDLVYDINVNLFRSGDIIGTYSANWNVSWQDIMFANQIIIPVIFDSNNPQIIALNSSLIPKIQLI